MCPPCRIYRVLSLFYFVLAATAEVIAVELPGERFAWNRKPLIRLGGEGDLKWSTIVGGEVELGTAKAFVFCVHKFSGGPAIVRSHLLAEIKPNLWGRAKQWDQGRVEGPAQRGSCAFAVLLIWSNILQC